MAMRIQPDTLRDEISQVSEIINKWSDRLSKGIPGDEIPSNDLNVEIFLYQLRGELQLAAERILAVVEVLEQ